MEEPITEETLDRTIDACAWLVSIAQQSVDRFGWSDEIVRYVEQLGRAAFAAKARQVGGMGAVAPMVTH